VKKKHERLYFSPNLFTIIESKMIPWERSILTHTVIRLWGWTIQEYRFDSRPSKSSHNVWTGFEAYPASMSWVPGGGVKAADE
jgi:hypothetical protein